MNPLVATGVSAGLLAANAFFVAAEFSLLAARRSRIEALAAEGDHRARRAAAGLRQLSLMLAGAQLGITMASLGLGAVAEPALAGAFERLLEPTGLGTVPRHTVAFVVGLAIVVLVHMVVGEMAPKSWAITHPERSALSLAGPFRAFVLVLRPFIRVLNALANGLVRLLGVTPQDERALAHSPADLALLLQESAEHGTLAEEEHALLSRSLSLSGLDAVAAMTPRREVVWVDAATGVPELEDVMRRSGRSRVLVADGDLDRVDGMVHFRDVLRLDDVHRSSARAGDLVRPVLAVPEHRPLEDVLLDLRERRRRMAVVVDEVGTTIGLLTVEDVLEELIGEFEDETDRGRRRIRRGPDGAWFVAGTVRPDELARRTGVELPEGEGDWDTVAGWIMSALGRIPVVGDRLHVEGASVEVVRMEGLAVVEVVVRPSRSSDAVVGAG